MNDNKQRIELAKLDGYRRDNPNVGPKHEKVWGWWVPGGKFHMGNSILPDYLNDLNAIQKVVLKVVTEKVEEISFSEKLIEILNRINDGKFRFLGASHFCLATAPARYIAEALLRIKDKWEDSPPFEIESDQITIGKKTGPLKL
jgi:hypothetical protein